MIAQKEKPCKGTGQATGHGCGKRTMYRVYGLGKMCCYPSWLTTSDAGKAKLYKAITKVQKPRLEFEKALNERKASTALKSALQSTKKLVHEFVRERDKGKPCISCGEPWQPDFQAGHFYKAELFITLKFDLHNIHGQCPGCNLHKEGNLNLYELSLPNRIGAEKFEALRQRAKIDKTQVKVWNTENLKEIRNQVKQLMKNGKDIY